MEFQPFQKIPRLSRDIVVTEKLDGENAQISISDDGTELAVGSRTQWLTDVKGLHGFAYWAALNKTELLRLGPGRHYGEWWGNGIKRGYGLQNGDKRFSLFNVHKWGDPATRPACCGVVPVLYEFPFDTDAIDAVIAKLDMIGSVAVPGFRDPEGIVIFHTASGHLYKKTVKNDEKPKGGVL